VAKLNQSQFQRQTQKQEQKLSHLQIQALNMLSMSLDDLKFYVYKEIAENPALEVVKKRTGKGEYRISGLSRDSDANQMSLEATEDINETLQSHLMHQLNAMNLSKDEVELSKKLIYNLDVNGFYGSMLAPESLLDKSRPVQNKAMLERCISRIQAMDPIGTCCKSPEESLYVQAKLDEDCPELALFILNGHIDLLSPPEPLKVYQKLLDFQKEWHSKTFAGRLDLDDIKFDEYDVEDAINFILRLNLHPAQGFTKDTNSNFESPDIVLKIEKIPGPILQSDYEKGLVAGDRNFHFQVKYASGELPELRISKDFIFDKVNATRAQELIDNLAFRESTIVLQGCAIVEFQKDFFLKGKGHLSVLTRKTIADSLGIHESTVSRMSAKKGSKYFQTEWGLFPAAYFFPSGVSSGDGKNKISSDTIKIKMQEIIEEHKGESLSDSKLTQLLNEQGIKIARRTVAKYRSQSGIQNSYIR